MDVPDTLPLLLIMPCKIERVIGNLLHNAIWYSPISGTIELTVVENKPTQQNPFTLQDEGMGISSKDQLSVFERFLEQDRSKSSQSGCSGLGLAIAKSLIEMHKEELV